MKSFARNLDVEFNRKLDQERTRIEAHARLTLGEEFNRREAQYKAQLESAQREAADLKRKLDQGSQQMQGEALELSLEALLKSAFPLDEIVPVPKGVTGADLLQRVRSASGQLCGTIITPLCASPSRAIPTSGSPASTPRARSPRRYAPRSSKCTS